MIDEFGMHHLNKPCLDLYCMNLSFEVARKSFDPSSHCGCVAIDIDGGISSAGYNGPPQGSIDEEIPLTRPEKYIFFEHAERNCIYMAARKGTPLRDAVFYTTGIPCSDCLRAIIQIQASRVVYGPYMTMMQNSEEYMKRYPALLKGQKIIVERFKYDEGLYRFNPRVRTIIEERDVIDVNFEWNTEWGYEQEFQRRHSDCDE